MFSLVMHKHACVYMYCSLNWAHIGGEIANDRERERQRERGEKICTSDNHRIYT